LIKLWNDPTSTTRLNQPGGVVDGSVEQNRFILLPKRVSSPTRIQAYLPKDTNNKKNSHQWKENKDLVVVGRYFEPQVTR
jgi:hypothetical protein